MAVENAKPKQGALVLSDLGFRCFGCEFCGLAFGASRCAAAGALQTWCAHRGMAGGGGWGVGIFCAIANG